jgi:hypothetical protein
MSFSVLKKFYSNRLSLENARDRGLLLSGQSALHIRNTIDPQFRDLRDAELKVFSQWGEDGIIDFICHKLDMRKPKMLEFGVGDFSECNSRFLVENRNASVVLVDSNVNLLPFVKSQDCYWKSTVVPLNKWITRDNAQLLLDEASRLLDGLDIVSIDLDGNDYWILNEMNLQGVRVVITEYNPVFGALSSISVPALDDFDRNQIHFSNLYYGASLRAFINLMEAKGFEFAGTNNAGSNAFFIEKNSFKFLEIEKPDASDLSTYCDWRVRESRDENGALTLLTGRSRWELIKHLPFVQCG